MSRACRALNLAEEKHLLFAKAHLVLAAKCRLNSVEETRAAFREANWALRRTKEELLHSVTYASPEIREDKATMLALLSANGFILRYCGPELREDPEMVLAACRDDGHAFQLARAEMKADRQFVLQAVRLSGLALAAAREDLRADREVVRAALRSNPIALKFASPELRQDRELFLEALKLQTRKSYLLHEDNLLKSLLPIGDVADKELLLEAARVNGQALESASVKLRSEKDFILEFMRAAPHYDQYLCYEEAMDSVQAAVELWEFEAACSSALAHVGEEAPVLTVTISSTPATPAGPVGSGQDQGQAQPLSCEATLLSGSSFTCSLPSRDASDFEAARPDLPRSLTVGELAALLRAELRVQMQVDPQQAPARIFVVFATGDVGGDVNSEPVTPWDWKRPVTDFCSWIA